MIKQSQRVLIKSVPSRGSASKGLGEERGTDNRLGPSTRLAWGLARRPASSVARSLQLLSVTGPAGLLSGSVVAPGPGVIPHCPFQGTGHGVTHHSRSEPQGHPLKVSTAWLLRTPLTGMGPRLGRPCDAGRGLPKAACSGRAPNALRTRLPSCQMRWGQVHVAGVGREQATRHMQSALPERSMAAPQADGPQGRTAATLCFLRLFSRYGHRNTVTVGCQKAQSLGWERVGPASGPAPSGGVLSPHAA